MLFWGAARHVPVRARFVLLVLDAALLGGCSRCGTASSEASADATTATSSSPSLLPPAVDAAQTSLAVPSAPPPIVFAPVSSTWFEVAPTGSAFFHAEATSIRYAVARVRSNGIEILLNDKPVDCKFEEGARSARDAANSVSKAYATLRLPPDLEGRFFARREVSARLALSQLGRAVAGHNADRVMVHPFEALPGAHVSGQIVTSRNWAGSPMVGGTGTFDGVLCDDPELAEIKEGWRPPAVNAGAVAGRVFDSQIDAFNVVANMILTSDGRKVLESIALWKEVAGLADHLKCLPSGSEHVLSVQPFSPLDRPTTGAIPAAFNVSNTPKTALPVTEDHAAGVLSITSFGDVIEGTVTAWSTYHPWTKQLRIKPSHRTAEISGTFRARRCGNPRAL